MATAGTRNFVHSQWNEPCSSIFKPATTQTKPSKDEIPLQMTAQISWSAKKDLCSCFTGVYALSTEQFHPVATTLSTQEVLILAYNIISGCRVLRMHRATVITRKNGPTKGQGMAG